MTFFLSTLKSRFDILTLNCVWYPLPIILNAGRSSHGCKEIFDFGKVLELDVHWDAVQNIFAIFVVRCIIDEADEARVEERGLMCLFEVMFVAIQDAVFDFNWVLYFDHVFDAIFACFHYIYGCDSTIAFRLERCSDSCVAPFHAFRVGKAT